MTLTRDFRGTVRARVLADLAFRDALFRSGVEAMLVGDVDSGKALLRDYIKATVGFEKLGAATGASPNSVIRMCGPSGNPQARNLFAVISHLQRDAGLTLHVMAESQLALRFAVAGHADFTCRMRLLMVNSPTARVTAQNDRTGSRIGEGTRRHDRGKTKTAL